MGSGGPKGDQGATGQPGAIGPSGGVGPAGPTGATGPQGVKGDTGSQGAKGDTGAPANTLLGQVTVAEGGMLGVRLAGIQKSPELTLAGAVVGERYQPFCRSYKLNGGASVAGCPVNYTMLDARCNTAGKVIVAYDAPTLSVGASFEFKVDIVKVNAS